MHVVWHLWCKSSRRVKGKRMVSSTVRSKHVRHWHWHVEALLLLLTHLANSVRSGPIHVRHLHLLLLLTHYSLKSCMVGCRHLRRLSGHLRSRRRCRCHAQRFLTWTRPSWP